MPFAEDSRRISICMLCINPEMISTNSCNAQQRISAPILVADGQSLGHILSLLAEDATQFVSGLLSRVPTPPEPMPFVCSLKCPVDSYLEMTCNGFHDAQ